MSINNPDPRIKPPLGSYIDWSHPLTEDLALFYVFNDGDGAFYDVLNEKKPVLIHGSLLWDEGHLHIDSSTALDTLITQEITGPPITIVTKVKFFTLVGREDFISKHDYNYALVRYNDNCWWSVHSDGGWRNVSCPGVNTDTYHFVAGSTGPMGSFCLVDNQKVISNYSTFDITPATHLWLGAHSGDYNSYPANIVFQYIFIYKKQLSDIDLEQLQNEPYCFISWPSQTLLFDLGSSAAIVQRQIEAPCGWSRYFLRGAALNLSSTTKAGRTIDTPVSYSRSLSRLFSIPASMLYHLQQEGELLAEALTSLTASRDMQVDWFSNLVITAGKEIPISALRYTASIKELPAERLVVSKGAHEQLVAWLACIEKEVILQTDWQGALLITKEGIFPVDFVKLLEGGADLNLDWHMPIMAQEDMVIEALSRISPTAGSSIEVLSGIASELTSALCWIEDIVAAKNVGPTWLAFTSFSGGTVAEWVVPVSGMDEATVSWLTGLAKEAGLPVEVAGEAIRVEVLKFLPRIPRLEARYKIKESLIN